MYNVVLMVIYLGSNILQLWLSLPILMNFHFPLKFPLLHLTNKLFGDISLLFNSAYLQFKQAISGIEAPKL